jgi:hypothetical protein
MDAGGLDVDGEQPEATIEDYSIVRSEGARMVERQVAHPSISGVSMRRERPQLVTIAYRFEQRAEERYRAGFPTQQNRPATVKENLTVQIEGRRQLSKQVTESRRIAYYRVSRKTSTPTISKNRWRVSAFFAGLHHKKLA